MIYIDLEGIMLNEINQTERQISYNLIYMWNLKKQNKNRLIENKWAVARGERLKAVGETGEGD